MFFGEFFVTLNLEAPERGILSREVSGDGFDRLNEREQGRYNLVIIGFSNLRPTLPVRPNWFTLKENRDGDNAGRM